MRLVAQVSESMAGTNAELTRNYPSGTFSRDHAGRFSHLNASRGVTSRCGTDGVAQIFKRNEDHEDIPKNSKNSAKNSKTKNKWKNSTPTTSTGGSANDPIGF